jgi:hypothetical protein
MKCPGSVRLSAGLPNISSEHAIEGTRAHALAELSLNDGADDPVTFLGMTLEGGIVTEEMVDHVRTFVDHCRFLREMCGPANVWVERRFNLAAFNPPAPMFGTADFVAYDALSKTLHVVDLKYGQGVVVEVTGNPQLRYYALGAGISLDGTVSIERVVITIVQPRAAHIDGPIRSEEIDYLDLVGWSSELFAAAAETTKPDAPLVAGDHCRWCLARAQCPERREHALAVAQQEFSVIEPAKPFTPPVPELIPDEQFFAMMSQLDVLDDWSKSMRARANAMLEEGKDVPGFKLVERRANRKWSDADTAMRVLTLNGNTDDEIFEPRTLKSPAQIEKLLGKKLFSTTVAEHVTKKSSGVTMVSADDARPAVQRLAAGDEFGILPSSTTSQPDGRE